jgi:hypothetical protein
MSVGVGSEITAVGWTTGSGGTGVAVGSGAAVGVGGVVHAEARAITSSSHILRRVFMGASPLFRIHAAAAPQGRQTDPRI